jgi:heme exporter protein D
VGGGITGGAVMTVSEFFAMNGYALYVWGSYGVTVLVFLAEIVLIRHKRKITLQQVRLLNESNRTSIGETQ